MSSVGDIVGIEFKVGQLIAVIESFRFVKRMVGGQQVWILRGELAPDEMREVQGLLRYEQTIGRYTTTAPTRVIAKLLEKKMIPLDFLLALKFLSAYHQGRSYLLYVVSTAYQQLVINRKENDRFRNILRSAVFRGNLFELNPELREGLTLVDEPKFYNVQGRSITKMRMRDDAGDGYIVVIGDPPLADDDGRFPAYMVIFRERDVKGLDDKTLMRAIMLGYYADMLAVGMGEVEKVYAVGDEKEGLRAIVGKLMRYDPITEKARYGGIANLYLEMLGKAIPVGTYEFKTVEEAKEWVEKEVMPRYQKVIKEYEAVFESGKGSEGIYL